jgi:hypothetical protein
MKSRRAAERITILSRLRDGQIPRIARKRAQHALESLAERLRDGPLTSLILLQRRTEEFTAQQPSGDDLMDALESLIGLMQTGMIQFHGCVGELQRLVDCLAREHTEQEAGESAARLRPN